MQPQKSNIANIFKTFENLTALDLNINELKKVATSWDQPSLPSKLKDFIFKFIYNKLPTNTRLLHMTDDQIDRACTFCSAAKLFPAPVEKFEHLVWSCPIAQSYISKIISEFLPEIQNITTEQKKNFFFTGLLPVAAIFENWPIVFNIVRSLTLHTLWEYHQQKKKFQAGNI